MIIRREKCSEPGVLEAILMRLASLEAPNQCAVLHTTDRGYACITVGLISSDSSTYYFRIAVHPDRGLYCDVGAVDTWIGAATPENVERLVVALEDYLRVRSRPKYPVRRSHLKELYQVAGCSNPEVMS